MGSVAELKRVCVIGAGPIGLVAIKNISRSVGLSGTVFEQMDRVGGLWHYVEDTERDVNKLPVHTALYSSLRTNVMKELLQFEEFPFPEVDSTGYAYFRHKEVEKYLNDYADNFGLRKYIRLNTKVISVRPQTPESAGISDDFSTKWRVVVQNIMTGTTDEHIFDAVIVANGKFSDPIVPELEGLKTFEGKISHTKSYRRPDKFVGNNVVILGLGPSAADIGHEISQVANSVVMCHRAPIKIRSKKMRILEDSIVLVKKSSVILGSGEEVPCDAIVFATGYALTFPFLHPDCGITVQDKKYVTPLYKYFHSVNYPTLCFPCIFAFTPEWVASEIQIMYFAQYLEGKVTLPPEAERQRAIKVQEAESDAKGVLLRHRFKLGVIGEEVYTYLQNLTHDAEFTDEFKNMLALKRVIFAIDVARLFNHIELFRSDKLKWIDSTCATYYCIPDPEGNEEAELLTLQLNEKTKEITITSSLGEVRNKPYLVS